MGIAIIGLITSLLGVFQQSLADASRMGQNLFTATENDKMIQAGKEGTMAQYYASQRQRQLMIIIIAVVLIGLVMFIKRK